jgi:T-complex protein 11
LPAGHPILLTLRSPLAPTTSPLHSALLALKDVLSSLKERCAPNRDGDINKVFQTLDEWHYSSPSVFRSSPSILSALASCIVDAAKTIIHLTELMKSDLDTAVLGSMSEIQVKELILQKAKEEERDFVIRQWTTESEPGGQVLRRNWRSWLMQLPESTLASYGPVPQESRWLVRLMVSLESDTPVSCNLPAFPTSQSKEEPPDGLGDAANELPPHFLLVSRRLFYIQNYIQAIVITAALQVLAGLPSVRQTDQESSEPRFLERVWTLLKMEVEAEEMNRETLDQSTKLINLCDEVIQARRSASPGLVDANEEARIRSSVDRTLRPRDPVFVLLRRRLIESAGRELVKHLASPNIGRAPQIPVVMRTGRGLTSSTEKAGTRPRLQASDPEALPSYGMSGGTKPSFSVKGFEDPVLVNAIGETFDKILSCIHWVSGVWGDLV